MTTVMTSDGCEANVEFRPRPIDSLPTGWVADRYPIVGSIRGGTGANLRWAADGRIWIGEERGADLLLPKDLLDAQS